MSEQVTKEQALADLDYLFEEQNSSYAERLLERVSDYIEQSQPVPEWKPIETAPMDGKEVLVYCSDTGEQMVAFWHPRHKGWQFAIGPLDGAHTCTPCLWQAPPAAPQQED